MNFAGARLFDLINAFTFLYGENIIVEWGDTLPITKAQLVFNEPKHGDDAALPKLS